MVQLRMTPQAGVHGVGGWITQSEEVIVVDIGDGAARRIYEVASVVSGDEASFHPLKIAGILRNADCSIAILGVNRCWFWGMWIRHGASANNFREMTLASPLFDL